MTLEEWLGGESIINIADCLNKVIDCNSSVVDELVNSNDNEYWHVDVLEDGIAVTWCFD